MAEKICRKAFSDVFSKVTRKEMEQRFSRNRSQTWQRTLSRLLLKQLGDKIPRSPAGRLATGWLPQMQSEKRLRGNTFCVDPDSVADSHDSRQTRKWLQIRHSRPTKTQEDNSALRPPARPPTFSTPPSSYRGWAGSGSGSYFQDPAKPGQPGSKTQGQLEERPGWFSTMTDDKHVTMYIG
ncbi:uncharacterized protein LOC123969463 isoform X2 [Micropterus dolomieu]|uniref:uncharacterized protein LOC123969463 isoform X2 n=1 Tax=Micropterus dolomieu TaxID=147949 RepID=UPI001E8DC9A8|nr:uncharacterized protein LOC123969463 isoform X2 [Micropterus dolomieu]